MCQRVGRGARSILTFVSLLVLVLSCVVAVVVSVNDAKNASIVALDFFSTFGHSVADEVSDRVGAQMTDAESLVNIVVDSHVRGSNLLTLTGPNNFTEAASFIDTCYQFGALRCYSLVTGGAYIFVDVATLRVVRGANNVSVAISFPSAAAMLAYVAGNTSVATPIAVPRIAYSPLSPPPAGQQLMWQALGGGGVMRVSGNVPGAAAPTYVAAELSFAQAPDAAQLPLSARFVIAAGTTIVATSSADPPACAVDNVALGCDVFAAVSGNEDAAAGRLTVRTDISKPGLPMVVAVAVPRDAVFSPLDAGRRVSLGVAFAIAVCATAVGAAAVYVAVVRPLTRLAAGMRRVAELEDDGGDDGEERLCCGRALSEVEAIADSFATMSAALRRYKQFIPEVLFLRADQDAPADDAAAAPAGRAADVEAPAAAGNVPTPAGSKPTTPTTGHPPKRGSSISSPAAVGKGAVAQPAALARLGGLMGVASPPRVASVVCFRLSSPPSDVTRMEVAPAGAGVGVTASVVVCAEGGEAPVAALKAAVVAVHAHRGVVDGLVGDDLIASFGVHRRVAEPAALAALMAAFAARRTAPPGLGVGVATSPLWAEHVEARAFRALTVRGAAVRAARGLAIVAGGLLACDAATATAARVESIAVLPGVHVVVAAPCADEAGVTEKVADIGGEGAAAVCAAVERGDVAAARVLAEQGKADPVVAVAHRVLCGKILA